MIQNKSWHNANRILSSFVNNNNNTVQSVPQYLRWFVSKVIKPKRIIRKNIFEVTSNIEKLEDKLEELKSWS